MNKIFVVDAVNFLFRSYYAIGPMTNPKGESTGALFGFIRSILKVIKDFSPTHFVAVFDGPDNKRSRTDIYSEYKSHRKGMPEDLIPQLDKAEIFCQLAGIPLLCIPGVEADDTMGSIATWAGKKGAEVFICTSDKDLCQFVNERTFVVNVYKDNLIIDKEKVVELFGVKPEQIVDYLAITGDASDNIPGLEGFGPKTAATLLQEFGSLDNLLSAPEKVAGKKKQETLISGRETALLSRRLALIQTDVEFPREEEFFRLKAAEADELKAFYLEQHFLSLLKEIEPAHKKIQKEVSYRLVEEEAELISLVEKWLGAKELCIDTETTELHPMRARLVGLGIGVAPGEAWYVPMNSRLGRRRALALLSPLFESAEIGFYGHNIKYDLHVLANEGIALRKVSFDTMLASYLLSPQVQRHNLDALSLEKFGKVKIPIEDLIGKGKKEIGMLDVPIEKVSEYCCEDVDYTCRLKELFAKELLEQDLKEVFEKIEIPLLPVLAGMERKGIFVDVEKLKKMSKELAGQIEHLQKEIYKVAGEEFNLNSPKQLSVILFEKMGIKPPKKTATGYSTDAEVLESLKESAPVVSLILDYRTLEKLRSTYVDALPEQIQPATGRIHCTFMQSVAATGRLACQDPNLQNIPVRTKEGRKIREAFRPQADNASFLSGDYSQIELRLLAHLSADPSLMKAFVDGEDVHTFTAALVFDVPLKSVTDEMRQRAKAVNFGIIYGQQAYGLSQQLSISYEEAEGFIQTYFQRYKQVKEFLEHCKEQTRKTGYAITITGRKRPIPEILSKNPQMRSAAERLAVNTPLQGSQADLIKLAMLQISDHLKERPELGSMILQIHDELLFEAPDSSLDALSKLVKSKMEGIFSLNVPIVVDISIGKNWGEC
jgi:DNA polymerase I